MQKRRVFKRSKPPKVEKKPEKKAAQVKKAAVKKVIMSVKPVKVVESEKKPEAHRSHIAFKPHEHKVQTNLPPKDDQSIAENIQESAPADIIVVDETTVAESQIRPEADLNRKASFIWIFLGIFVVFLSGGLAFAFLFQQPQEPEQVYTAPTDKPTPTVAKTAAPKPTEWKIEVLNGSGIPGAAAAIANKLKSAGYTNVTTGNADTTQVVTTFYLSKDFLPFAENFTEDLKKQQITAKDGGELSENSISARIIIGTE